MGDKVTRLMRVVSALSISKYGFLFRFDFSQRKTNFTDFTLTEKCDFKTPGRSMPNA